MAQALRRFPLFVSAALLAGCPSDGTSSSADSGTDESSDTGAMTSPTTTATTTTATTTSPTTTMADSSTTSEESSSDTGSTDPTSTGTDESSSSESGSESSSSSGGVLCTAPELECDGECIDPETSLAFCGATDCTMGEVGVACAPSGSCVKGECLDTCDNCSFESGDFTGWTTVDLEGPFVPLTVDVAGVVQDLGTWSTFTTAPTDGLYSAITGFDGNGATSLTGPIQIGQDITLDADTPANLEFDYRVSWNMVDFVVSTADRTLQVQIEPEGGGEPMDTEVILTAAAATIEDDTGDLVGVVDLGPYAGTTVYVRIMFIVPEDSSGPALATIDDVRVVAQ